MAQRRKNYLNEDRTTRDLILDLAENEIAKRGVEGLRLKDVAEQVGIQLPSLYAHFSGRKELLEALADRAMDEVDIIYKELAGLPPRESLLAGADRMIDFYRAKNGYARLILADMPIPHQYSLFIKARPKVEAGVSYLNDTIKRGVAQNTVRDVSAELFLSFRMGVTLVPLFIHSNSQRQEMVKDPEVIDRIKLEAHHMLSQFISVR